MLNKRRSGDTDDGGEARIESRPLEVPSCSLTFGVIVRLYWSPG
jgi:hypothetical protein